MVKRYAVHFSFVCAAFPLFFFWLGRIPLWSSDEGRYGEIAREILERKNFILPTFNYVVYLEKPVLAPLLTALSYFCFGVSSWSTRLPVVLSALFGILMCYQVTRRLFSEKTAQFASIVLSTSIGYVLVGRYAVIDMLMTFWMSGSLFCLMTAYFEKSRRYYLFSYILMGLGFLTKGLIGILLPFLTFFIFLIWARDIRAIKNMSLGWAFIIIGIIIAPWMIAASAQEPDFFKVFIIQHHFARFSTKMFGRSRPFWFFVPIVIGLYFPWVLFLPVAVRNGLKTTSGEARDKIKFLISWMVTIFIFFSIPKSKLPYYILPTSMPIAILVGRCFEHLVSMSVPENSKRAFLSRVWNLFIGVCWLGIIGGNIYLLFENKMADVILLKPLVRPGSIALLGLATAAYISYRRKQMKKAFGILAGMMYLGLLLTVAAMRVISPAQSTSDFAKIVKSLLRETDVVALFASPDRFSDFPFYLQRRVVIFGPNRGTLAQGSEDPKHVQEAKDWFVNEGDLAVRMNAEKERIFCLMKEEEFEYLLKIGLEKYQILKREYGKVLIASVNVSVKSVDTVLAQ